MSEGYEQTEWTNGSWKIRWFNQDEVEITGPYDRKCFIDGGDFEYALQALCAAYDKGNGRTK